jgi:glycine cleavage system H protein
LPKVGQAVNAKGTCAVVESVKAASDIYAPLSGEIVSINEALTNHLSFLIRNLMNHGFQSKTFFA